MNILIKDKNIDTLVSGYFLSLVFKKDFNLFVYSETDEYDIEVSSELIKFTSGQEFTPNKYTSLTKIVNLEFNLGKDDFATKIDKLVCKGCDTIEEVALLDFLINIDTPLAVVKAEDPAFVLFVFSNKSNQVVEDVRKHAHTLADSKDILCVNRDPFSAEYLSLSFNVPIIVTYKYLNSTDLICSINCKEEVREKIEEVIVATYIGNFVKFTCTYDELISYLNKIKDII